MPRIASTTTAGVPTMTLDALMARQKALADQQNQIAAPRQMISPWQGAAQLAEAFINARQGAATQDQLLAGREALAKLRAGINLDSGPTPDQIGQASLYDPNYADNLTQLAVEAIRSRRQREQQLADIASQREFQVGQTKEQQGFTHGENVAERQATIDAATIAAQRAADARKEQEAFQAGQADKNRTFEQEQQGRSQDFQKAQAEAARAAESFGPVITGPDAAAQGLDPSGHYQKSSKSGKFEPITNGSGLNITLPNSEVMGRLGVSQSFLDNFDNIREQAARGDLTGPIDYASAVVFGRGEAGKANRTISSGVDGLRRMLTGAGMPASEAADYVSRYSPGATDDAATLANKLDGLKTDLINTRQSILAGHVPAAMQGNPALQVDPNAGKAPPAAQLPQGVTEDDIAETMRANKMTRQQVLDALKTKGGASGRP